MGCECKDKDRVAWNIAKELSEINGNLASLKYRIDSLGFKLMLGVVISITAGIAVGMFIGYYTISYELGNITESYTYAYTQGYITGVQDALNDPVSATLKYVCLSNQTTMLQVDGVQFMLSCNETR